MKLIWLKLKIKKIKKINEDKFNIKEYYIIFQKNNYINSNTSKIPLYYPYNIL